MVCGYINSNLVANTLWQNCGVNRLRYVIAAVPMFIALLVYKAVAHQSWQGAFAAAAVTFVVVAGVTVTLWNWWVAR